MTEAEQLSVVNESAPSGTADMPDYLLEPNAVLLDKCRWRHGQVLVSLFEALVAL